MTEYNIYQWLTAVMYYSRVMRQMSGWDLEKEYQARATLESRVRSEDETWSCQKWKLGEQGWSLDYDVRNRIMSRLYRLLGYKVTWVATSSLHKKEWSLFKHTFILISKHVYIAIKANLVTKYIVFIQSWSIRIYILCVVHILFLSELLFIKDIWYALFELE